MSMCPECSGKGEYLLPTGDYAECDMCKEDIRDTIAEFMMDWIGCPLVWRYRIGSANLN